MSEKREWKKEKEQLERLINIDKESYESIGRKYNVSGTAIKKIAKKLGIMLPQRRIINSKETFGRGQDRGGKTYICKNCGKEFKASRSKKNVFCSVKCFVEYKHKEKYNNFLKGDKYYLRANYNLSYFKNDILKEQNNKCAICGCLPEHNGKPLVFIIDHIDGDASNNIRKNLRCICPNCDSQLPTYKSKNKNSARKYRYKK